jgi:hypothetical protein
MNHRKVVATIIVLPFVSSCSFVSNAFGMGVDHVTFSEEVENIDLPVNVSSIGWNWESPEDTSIMHVSPTLYGAAVSISDGVIGLHGNSGEELWRYRRPGAMITGSNVTPDGESVIVSYSKDGESEAGSSSLHEVVLLDSSTGEIKGTHEVEFFSMGIITDDVKSYSSVEERLGVISNDSRIIYRDADNGNTDVMALGLEDNGERWRVSPSGSEGNDDKVFVPKDAVVSGGVLILSCVFIDDSLESVADLGERQEHTIAVMGINVDTGSEVWRHEIDVNAPVETQPVELAVDQRSGNLTAVASGNGYHEEWIVDPADGRVLTDNDFFDDEGNRVIGVLENAVVTARGVSGRSEYEYSYTEFSGGTERTVTTAAPPERREDSFTLVFDESVAWLDVNRASSSSWEPAQLVVTDWASEEPRVIDLGIEVQRNPDDDGSMGDFAPVPAPVDMTLAPGSLVVAEHRSAGEGGVHHLVGVIP